MPLALGGLGLVAQSNDVDVVSALAIVWSVAAILSPAAITAVLAAIAILVVLVGVDTQWAAVVGIGLAAVGIPLVARSRVTVRAGDGEHLELERGLGARRRWIVPAASTLSYVTEHGLLGGVLPTNRVRIVVADRGARGISAWGLSAADLAATRALLESRSTIGTYDFRRDRATTVDP